MSPIIFLAILLLVGLTVAFNRVSSVFIEKYSINIIPPAIVQMIAVITFLVNYDGDNQSNTIFLILSVFIMIIVTDTDLWFTTLGGKYPWLDLHLQD